MPEPGSAQAGANDATVAAVTNSPDAAQVLRRLYADVVQCQRVLDELLEGADRQAAKAAEVEKIYKAKAKETEKAIAAAKRELKDAQGALKAVES